MSISGFLVFGKKKTTKSKHSSHSNNWNKTLQGNLTAKCAQVFSCLKHGILAFKSKKSKIPIVWRNSEEHNDLDKNR